MGRVGVGAALLFLYLLSSSLFAADSDTIPLDKPTKPTAAAPQLPMANSPRVKPVDPAKAPVAPAFPKVAADEPYVAALEVYGSPRVTTEVLYKNFGRDIKAWMQQGLQGHKKALRLEEELVTKIKKKYELPFAKFTILQYFQPGNLALYITLDTVEKVDADRRMPFVKAPTSKLADPGKVIEKWYEYEKLALELYDSGQLDPKHLECRTALHCPFGHKHPQLQKYEPFFEKTVKKYEKEIAKIATYDQRPEYRGATVYLIPYLGNGTRVIPLMIDRIHDPDATVRNNALRVLGDIAEKHPKYHVPIKPIIEALDYPRVSDRSKAAYVLYALSLHSAATRKNILEQGFGPLLRLLQSKQPNHYETAHVTLRKISGKDFPVDKPKTWQAWYDKNNAHVSAKPQNKRTPTNKP